MFESGHSKRLREPLCAAEIKIGNEGFISMRVGIIGCGNISDIYVRNAKAFYGIEIFSCAYIFPAAADQLARKYSLREMSVPDLLAAPDIEIILNLTLPTAHAEVSR